MTLKSPQVNSYMVTITEFVDTTILPHVRNALKEPEPVNPVDQIYDIQP